MGELIIRVKVSDDLDPTLTDPQDLAGDIIDTFTHDLRHRVSADIGGVELASAEWGGMAVREVRRLKAYLGNHPKSQSVRMTRDNAEFVIDALLGGS
jgi:hypothetical protein